MPRPPSYNKNKKFFDYYERRLRRLRQQAFDYELTDDLNYRSSLDIKSKECIDNVKKILDTIYTASSLDIYFLDYVKNIIFLKVG
jgi:hypothetical protein